MTINQPERERPSVPNPGQPAREGIDLSVLPSAQPRELGLQVTIGDAIIPEITSLPEGQSMQITEGRVLLDRDALERAKQGVIGRLRGAIESGDEHVVAGYSWYLEDSQDPDVVALRNQIQEALQQRNAAHLQLDALNVHLPTEGMAQRQLIKEGLQREISRYPFSFRGRDGQPLNQEDLDFVFTRHSERPDTFKMIVASRRGIEAIAVPDPENFPQDKFQVDFASRDLAKDPNTGAMTIPLKAAADGTMPAVAIIEIRKEAVDLPAELIKKEEEQNVQPPSRQQPPSARPYTPQPPQFPGPTPRAQRPTTWTAPSSH